MKTKAKYFVQLENKLVKCTLCPHECILSLNKYGICRTRKNIDGELFTLAYSNPCAVNIDPIEKKPLFHFLPGTQTFSIATAGCNLACLNCQNHTISQVSPEQTDNYNLIPQQVVESTIKNNCQSISYTYTDPVAFYEYTLDTAKIAKKNNIKNVIVSAGYINQEPLLELIPYIDAANIDLKNFCNNTYKKINHATLEPILNTLKTLKKYNVWLEITYLLIPDINSSNQMLNDVCKWLKENNLSDVPLHFSRFYPTYKLNNISPTSLDLLKKAFNIAKNNNIKYVYIGNVAGTNFENTICPNCNRTIIERIGFKVKTNNISNSKCKFCECIIDGIWDN